MVRPLRRMLRTWRFLKRVMARTNPTQTGLVVGDSADIAGNLCQVSFFVSKDHFDEFNRFSARFFRISSKKNGVYHRCLTSILPTDENQFVTVDQYCYFRYDSRSVFLHKIFHVARGIDQSETLHGQHLWPIQGRISLETIQVDPSPS